MAADRLEAAERLRTDTCAQLRAFLAERLPVGVEVMVFGSLIKPGRFSSRSDIDIALTGPVDEAFADRLAVEIEEAFERRADVLVLGQTRLSEAILRTGERWTW